MSSTILHINIYMDWTSFSHGQIHSKVWLCQELEPFMKDDVRLAILGSWYNVLAFMLLTRNEAKYQSILGIDINESTGPIADKITDAWRIGKNDKVTNVIADANIYDLFQYDVVINCSPEHMNHNTWFENLNYGKLVCIQSSDVSIKEDDIWKCVNPNSSLEELVQKYPMSKYLFSGTKKFQYDDGSGYQRFMVIGIK